MTTSTVDRFVTLAKEMKMPLVGLGTFNSNISYSIETALKIGYRMIDTAFCYQNEEEIGKTLKRIFESEDTSIKREDLFIISKLPNNGHRNVKYFLKKSLKALQIDYLDLYLIHYPMAVKGEKDTDMYPIKDGTLAVDYGADIVETWKHMEEAVDLGLAKNIGLSNFNIRQLKRICENARIKPANLQVECHPFFQQRELHDFCKKQNISFTAYAPLGAPFLPELAAKLSLQGDPDFPSLLQHPLFLKLEEKYNKTPSQIILRWLVQRGIAVIPKSSQEAHLKENFDIFDFSLHPQDELEINNIEVSYRFYKINFLPGLAEHPEHPFTEEV